MSQGQDRYLLLPCWDAGRVEVAVLHVGEELLDGRDIVCVRWEEHDGDLQLPDGVDGSVSSVPASVVQQHHCVVTQTRSILFQQRAQETQVHGDDVRVSVDLRVAGVHVADRVDGHDQHDAWGYLRFRDAVTGGSNGPFPVTMVGAVDPALVEVDENLVLRPHAHVRLGPSLPQHKVLLGVLLGGDDFDPPISHIHI